MFRFLDTECSVNSKSFVQVFGAGRMVGKSSTLVHLPGVSVLVDIGANTACDSDACCSKANNDDQQSSDGLHSSSCSDELTGSMDRLGSRVYDDGVSSVFPDLASCPPIDALVLTHFHLDHVGGFPYELCLNKRLKWRSSCKPEDTHDEGYVSKQDRLIIATEATRYLGAMVCQDYVSLRESCYYHKSHIIDAFRGINRIVHENEEVEILRDGAATGVIKFFPSGHVVGSVSLLVTCYISCKRVFVSSDYCQYDLVDSFISRLDMPGIAEVVGGLGVELAVLEATHISTQKHAPTPTAAQQKIHDVVKNTLGKCVIASFSLGRAQCLARSLLAAGLTEKVRFTSKQAYQGYRFQEYLTQVRERNKSLLRFTEDVKGFPEIVKSSAEGSLKSLKKGGGSPPPICREVVFVGPISLAGPQARKELDSLKGPISESLNQTTFDDSQSSHITKGFLQHPVGKVRSSVILTGLAPPGTIGNALIKMTTVDRQSVVDGVSYHYIPISSHADEKGALELISVLKPKRILLVHGEERKMTKFAAKHVCKWTTDMPHEGEIVDI